MVTLVKNPEWHLIEGDAAPPVGLTLGEGHPLRDLVIAAWHDYDEACTDPDRHCDEGSERIAVTLARFEALAEATSAVASWIAEKAGGQ